MPGWVGTSLPTDTDDLLSTDDPLWRPLIGKQPKEEEMKMHAAQPSAGRRLN